MVYGVSGLISALVGVVGVSVALIAIEPLLIPLVLTVLLPGLDGSLETKLCLLAFLLADDSLGSGKAIRRRTARRA